MPATIPTTMKAVVVEPGHKVAIKDHPVPPIGDNDVLIKTVSVAQNPTDWKHVDNNGKPGTVLGVDFSGNVVKVGKNVSSPKVGDHVAGFVHGGCFEDEGAFAEYVKTPADLVWVVPKNTLSHDEAATLGCAFLTAVQDLYHPTRLGLVEPPAEVAGEDWILLYGGSSAVGQSLIQLAHASGYKIVTTASPRNFGLVKALGAEEVFDYRDPEVVSKIKKATGDSLTKAVDAIAELDSQRICAESLGPSGGKVVLVQSAEEEATKRKDVVLQRE
ncbi:chaperonin 10-like protein [Ganoderma leucocontextum]|nr:chaperonin 10-like protein [Ganoderma leucocontextum]